MAGVLDLYIHMRSTYVVKDSNASMGRFRSEVSSDKTVLELDNPKAHTIKEESTGRTSLCYDRLDRLLAQVCILW